MRSVITRRDKVHAYRAKIQSRFSQNQSLKRKIFILYFRFLFSRRITPFTLVPPVTNAIFNKYEISNKIAKRSTKFHCVIGKMLRWRDKNEKEEMHKETIEGRKVLTWISGIRLNRWIRWYSKEIKEGKTRWKTFDGGSRQETCNFDP